jgi:hypothetical protein
LISEHHVLEDLYAEWFKNKEHIQPLLKFFVDQLFQADIVNNGGYSLSNIKLLDVWQQPNHQKSFSEEILVIKD